MYRIAGVVLMLCLFCPSGASAKLIEAWGPYALPDEAVNCTEVPDQVYKVLPGYEPSEDDNLAFKGGAFGGKLCYNALYPPTDEMATMFDMAYMISFMNGYPLEELSTPQLAITGPLEDCWPQDLLFDDLNGDNAPDILMMVTCFNVRDQNTINNNVLWYTEKEQGDFHYRQDPKLNGVIAPYPDYESARAALIPALPGGSNEEVPPPPPPSQPSPQPTPPKSPPPSAPGISTCHYTTEWGAMTIIFDENTSTARGRYDYNDGRIQAELWEGNLEGVWTQSDARGRFAFVLGPDGFTGVWNFLGDQNWRGQWNGKLQYCE